MWQYSFSIDIVIIKLNQRSTIFTDADILKTVSEEVNGLLKGDPKLEREEHQKLRQRLDAYLKLSYEKLNL